MHTDYLRVRHRDRHDNRNFTVWQTLTKPTRFVATWDHTGADNPPATDADYTAATFCGAIDELTGSRNPFREPPIKQPSNNDQTTVSAVTTRTLQPELF